MRPSAIGITTCDADRASNAGLVQFWVARQERRPSSKHDRSRPLHCSEDCETSCPDIPSNHGSFVEMQSRERGSSRPFFFLPVEGARFCAWRIVACVVLRVLLIWRQRPKKKQPLTN